MLCDKWLKYLNRASVFQDAWMYMDKIKTPIISILLLLLLLGVSGCGSEGRSLAQINSKFPLPKNESRPTEIVEAVLFLDNYMEAVETAQRECKPLLVFFRLPGCASSQRMMETTFRDKEIKRLSSRFVCVQIDASVHADLCESANITGFPTILFMNHQGMEFQRLSGKQTPDQLALQMHVAIQTTAAKVVTSVR